MIWNFADHVNICEFVHVTREINFSPLVKLTFFTKPRKHLFNIPQCSIQNRNEDISVLNGALWDVEHLCTMIPMVMSWNWKVFHIIGHLWGESTGHWYIPPVASDADLWLSFQVGQKKLLNKQSSGQWLEMPWCPCDIIVMPWSMYLSSSRSWSHHDMEMLSVLQVLYEGNPPVIGGFPLQRPVIWPLVFLCCHPEYIFEWTVKWPVIWDTSTTSDMRMMYLKVNVVRYKLVPLPSAFHHI